MSVQPGWYPDPVEPSTQRYWDGEGWIGAPLPVDATPPPGPPAEPEPSSVPEPSSAAEPPGAAQPSPAAAAPSDTPRGRPQPPTTPPPPTPPGHPVSPGWPPSPHAAPPGWPQAAHPVPPRPHGLALAPLGARLVARLIDIGVLFLLTVAVNGWFVWQWVQEVSPLFTEAWQRSMSGDRSTEGLPQPDPRADNLVLVILLVTAALWFAYEVPALANTGQTFGKRVMRVKVVTLTGDQQLGFGRAARRWNTLGLPVFLWYCCGIGLVLQLIDCAFPLFDRPLRQALHDKRAATVVVQVPGHPATPGAAPAEDRTDTPGGFR